MIMTDVKNLPAFSGKKLTKEQLIELDKRVKKALANKWREDGMDVITMVVWSPVVVCILYALVAIQIFFSDK